MDITSTPRSRTGATAAHADAARLRAQRQRVERTETADRRDSPRSSPKTRARERDSYEPGAAAYAARAQMQKAPDQQRYTAHSRNDRNDAGSARRSTRA